MLNPGIKFTPTTVALINRWEADLGIFLRWAKVTKTGGFSSGNLVK